MSDWLDREARPLLGPKRDNSADPRGPLWWVPAKAAAPVPAAPNEPLTEDSLADFAYDLLNLWYIEDTNEPSLIEQFCDNFRDRFGIPGAAHDAQVRDAALTEAADAAPALVLAELLRSGLDEDETTHQIAAQVGTAIRSLQEGNK